MRAYTVGTVAVALNVDTKWLDNAISHHPIPHVSRKTQGVARRVMPGAVTTLELALRLVRQLGLPLGRSLDLSRNLLEAAGAPATFRLDDAITIAVDIDSLSAYTASRLAEAVEIAPVPRRGRPPR